MRTSELLKDCKIKLKISTDYALAKALKIDRARVADYMAGKRNPTPYALARIADCLGLNPLELIVEYEQISAKNETERSFWADFQQRTKKPMKGLLLALLCAVTLWTGLDQARNPAGFFRRLKHA